MGAGGMVTPPPVDVVVEPEASAAFLKLEKEFVVPSAPQLMAKTIPWPQ